jgi:choline dehydrogenase
MLTDSPVFHNCESEVRRRDGHLSNHYDFIVCGAGPAGSVIAARLAADRQVNVLLIEASGTDEVPEVMTPAQWPLNLGSERDWKL